MISTTAPPAAGRRPAPRLSWRVITGLAGAAGGAAIVTGAFLPWVETFAGLIQIPGVRGGNGRILAAAGILIAATGLYHAARGGTRSRWLVGVGGFAALGFCGYLLIQLAALVRALGGDSMVLARGGPGLWVTTAGSLAASSTLFLPSPPGAEPADGPPAGPTALRVRAGAMRRAVLRRTAGPEPGDRRRRLQVALGLAWLLDAALQFQPAMFGQAFVTQMLRPAAAADPAALAGPARWAGHLISSDVPAWNTAFALIQLALAAGLLWRPTVKAALAGSIGWALAVWWLGEGLGGLLAGTASPVTGAPGAVILYALAAVLAWPRRSRSTGAGGIAAASPLGRGWARAAWLVLWGSFAYLILQPAIRAPFGLHDALAAGAAGEPGWLAAIDRGAATATGSHGLVVCALLAGVFLLIAAGILHPATARPALVLAALAGLAIWVVGEDFGQILTGMATDPNSGPVLVLLAAVYWPLRQAAAEPPEPRAAAQAPAQAPAVEPAALALPRP